MDRKYSYSNRYQKLIKSSANPVYLKPRNEATITSQLEQRMLSTFNRPPTRFLRLPPKTPTERKLPFFASSSKDYSEISQSKASLPKEGPRVFDIQKARLINFSDENGGPGVEEISPIRRKWAIHDSIDSTYESLVQILEAGKTSSKGR